LPCRLSRGWIPPKKLITGAGGIIAARRPSSPAQRDSTRQGGASGEKTSPATLRLYGVFTSYTKGACFVHYRCSHD
jgi:hypothetical protein